MSWPPSRWPARFLPWPSRCVTCTAGSTQRPDQVKPTFMAKCPSLRLSTPPPAQCTMNASRMMARITTTTQKKNTMMPGTAYPATVLALATAPSYPPPADLFNLFGQGPCHTGQARRVFNGVPERHGKGDHHGRASGLQQQRDPAEVREAHQR